MAVTKRDGVFSRDTSLNKFYNKEVQAMNKLGLLKTGETVLDRYNSHLHETAIQLLPEALSQISADGRQFIVEEVDFGRPIGVTICVTTGPGDQIIFAKRPRRFGHSRFVIGKGPTDCSVMTVILKAIENNQFLLMTAYIGKNAGPEPWDKFATEASKEFWSKHALVWGEEPTEPGTETEEPLW
jgi:hypothetical protein